MSRREAILARLVVALGGVHAHVCRGLPRALAGGVVAAAPVPAARRACRASGSRNGRKCEALMTYAEKKMPGARVAMVYALTFGRARLSIGPKDQPVYDDSW